MNIVMNTKYVYYFMEVEINDMNDRTHIVCMSVKERGEREIIVVNFLFRWVTVNIITYILIL